MYQLQKDALVRFLRSRAEINKMSGALANMIKDDRGVDAALIPEKHFEHMADLSDKTGLIHAMFKIGESIVLCYPSEEREKYMEIREEVLSGGKRLLYSDLSYSEMKAAVDMIKAASFNFHVKLQTNGKFEILGQNSDKEEMDQIISMVNKEKCSDSGKQVELYRDTVFAHAINQISYALASSVPVVIGSENGSATLLLSPKGALLTDDKGKQQFFPRDKDDFEKLFTKSILKDLGGDRAPIKIFGGKLAEKLSENMPSMTLKDALKELCMERIPSIEKLEAIPDKIKTRHLEAYAVAERASCFCTQKVMEVEKCRPKPEVMKEYRDLHKGHIEAARTLRVDKGRDLGR